MTIEERKRIAIAKACGWKEYDHYPTGLLGRSERKWKSPAKGCLGQIDTPPDYFGDLNASHEMEKVLTAPQWEKYKYELNRTAEDAVLATAAERANAFVEALELEY